MTSSVDGVDHVGRSGDRVLCESAVGLDEETTTKSLRQADQNATLPLSQGEESRERFLQHLPNGFRGTRGDQDSPLQSPLSRRVHRSVADGQEGGVSRVSSGGV